MRVDCTTSIRSHTQALIGTKAKMARRYEVDVALCAHIPIKHDKHDYVVSLDEVMYFSKQMIPHHQVHHVLCKIRLYLVRGKHHLSKQTANTCDNFLSSQFLPQCIVCAMQSAYV